MKNSLEILEIKKETISVLNEKEPNIIIRREQLATGTSSLPCIKVIYEIVTITAPLAIVLFGKEEPKQPSQFVDINGICYISEVVIIG